MLNTFGDISPRTAVKAAKRLLNVGQPAMNTQRFGQPEVQEKNVGKVRKWRRYLPLPELTAPAAEGITPPGHKITYADFQATLQQYVSVVELTDVIEDTHEDPVLQTYMDRLGEQMAKTVEIVTFDILKSGSSAYYAGTATTRATVNATIARADLRLVVRSFDRNDASPITKMIAPQAKVGTAGIMGGFFALAHTDLEPDLNNMTGWRKVVEYASPENSVANEIGACERVRFLISRLYTPWEAAGVAGTTFLSSGSPVTSATACDVYPVVIFARDAFAVVRLQGMDAARVMVLNPNVPRGGDEAGQRGSVSTKFWYTAAILCEQWLGRVEVACTARPT